ncbi:MAG TPA: hypothetical protein PLR20_11655 [Syntrophales bacterium]|nr:hypothetical protein [Syntrophales bacterium]HOX93841.1 hypothetical protein [Syntrophales bacterium]HPI57009.1 hypothetical protein [Syntrophales bacterium]HPN23861.1 hypothetical protein [Syntrophales bacterium]HQM29996.1 hypothetical protein [Syntrophales bacterium]
MLATILTRILPVRFWIERTVAVHAKEAKAVREVIEARGFQRLPDYFGATFLDRVRCVTVERVPLPPFASGALRSLGGIRTARRYSGITYGDTYFIDKKKEHSESLHFHELIHAVQWDCLGFEKFLLTYGAGLVRKGYARNPLEVMAYIHQRRFETDPVPYPVEEAVRAELQSKRLKT